MSSKTLGLVLAIVGIIVTLISAFADGLGIGDQIRFGSQQIAGTVLGVLIFIVGVVIYYRQRQA